MCPHMLETFKETGAREGMEMEMDLKRFKRKYTEETHVEASTEQQLLEWMMSKLRGGSYEDFLEYNGLCYYCPIYTSISDSYRGGEYRGMSPEDLQSHLSHMSLYDHGMRSKCEFGQLCPVAKVIDDESVLDSRKLMENQLHLKMFWHPPRERHGQEKFANDFNVLEIRREQDGMTVDDMRDEVCGFLFVDSE